jgi:glutaminyl-peptide cyclotransferase
MRKMSGARNWLGDRWLEAVLSIGLLAIVIWLGTLVSPLVAPVIGDLLPKRGVEFDGQKAFEHVTAQMAIGPRPAGSQANRKTADYIAEVLKKNGWEVEFQDFTYKGTSVRNVIGKLGQGKGPVAVIGAHYDTRPLADNDPNTRLRTRPVPGANDGASGVAVLLELSRSLDKAKLKNEVWLAFFDAEDNGRLNGWPFSVGAEHMAQSLTSKPGYVVIADMIGDKDLNIYKEQNSTPELVERIWQIAADLGYKDWFIPQYKYSMTDDHTPFLQAGIPAIDLIDFDYPYWHTTQDTADKIAPESLQRVGRVIEALLEGIPSRRTSTR